MKRTPERAAALRLVALYRCFVRCGRRSGNRSFNDRDTYQRIYRELVKPFPRRAREIGQ